MVDCGTDYLGVGNVTVTGWLYQSNTAGKYIDNGSFLLRPLSGGGIRLSSNGGTTHANSANFSLQRKWTHFAVTRTSAGVANIYINGALSGSANQSSGTPAAATTNLIIGNRAAGSDEYRGLVSEFRMFNRILTVQEIQDLCFLNDLPSDISTSMLSEHLFNDGGGSTAYDTSGNGRNGTITGAVYEAYVPFKQRRDITNIIQNGDFEDYPVSGAGTNTANRWIDNTAGGSTNNVFNWAIPTAAIAATATASYDTSVKRSGSASMKLDLADATGTVTVQYGTRNSPPVTADKPFLIPLLPSTSYTLTAYIKTTNCATNAAFIDLREYSGTLSTVATNSSTKLSGTNDWTKVTLTFTTGSTTAFGSILLRHNVAGNVATAWFDDIVLTKTTPEARTASGSRLLVRDFGTALSFTQGSSHVVTIANASHLQLSTGFTVAAWALLNTRSGDSFKGIVSKGGTANGGERNYLLALNNGNTVLSSGYETVGGANRFATGTKLIPLNEWFHALVTWDGSNVQCYYNGAADGSPFASTGTPCITTASVEIGRNQPITTQEWDGAIDEVRIWSRALSASEVSRLYYQGYAPSNGLVGEWLLNEGSGATAYDSSGYGSNGVITGAVYTSNVRMIARTLVT